MTLPNFRYVETERGRKKRRKGEGEQESEMKQRVLAAWWRVAGNI